MKILHTADLHLGKRPFGSKIFSQKRYLDYFLAFNRLIDKAIENKIDLFIVAGDLFDKKELTPDVLRRTEEGFKRLKENNIKSFIIEGNHDNNTSEAINSWINYLETKGFLIKGEYINDGENYIFPKIKIDDINIYGLGYPGFNIDDVLEKLSLSINDKEKNIVVVHTSLGGGEYLPGLAGTSAINLLKDKCIYLAGGHTHSYTLYPAKEPFFFIPGSPEYWNVLKEKSDIKGGILFDTDTRTHKFIEIEKRKRIKLKFEITEDDEINEFKEFCKDLNLTGEELVILKISTDKYINTLEFENILEENGALKAYIEVKNKNKSIHNLENNENYSIKEMEENIISSWNLFKDPKNITNYLQNFKNYAEDKDRNQDFYELFDKMLEEELDYENK